jgi:N utilization substance protein B
MSLEPPQPSIDVPPPQATASTPTRRDVRRLAMQVLYQVDQRGEADHQLIRQSLDSGPDNEATCDEAFELAKAAWRDRKQADRLVTSLAPDWPTYRQPLVDRALLRLAHYEIVSKRSPYKIAINEAVELAKRYGGENSPAFINGVLDKLAKQVTPQGTEDPRP